ncbi:hypothetical protein [Adhaeribacter radiodurans]|uniref:Uncharacterized protein n=1 Tax=Adhaeribacter radiodurans TaxID=2745197 RepID=A0A7L7LCE8_9BACT|nr:hypothetical protein [Adhaeribacter radiodurans]QMU30518.1 hypothetical protein HUW48_21940 [Adhaeribacter radiodurans]
MMKRIKFSYKWLWVIFALFFSCKEEPEVTPIKEIIQLEIYDEDGKLIENGKSSIKANGTTKIKLVASIEKGVDEGNRTIKFKTSAGLFDVETENKTEKTVYATLDNLNVEKLTASTYLTLGTTSGKYVISASINSKSDYKVEKELEVLPLGNIDNITKFEIEDFANLNGKVKADGTTKIRLIAFVPKNATETNRIVEFNTSAGTFEVAAESKNKKEVLATRQNETDEMFTASTYLTLGTTSGKYIITANIKDKPDYKVEQVIEVLPLSTNESFIQFRIENFDNLNGKLKADGLTKVKLIASVPKQSGEANRTVEFNTSAGTFDVAGENKKNKEIYATLVNENDATFTATTFLTLDTTPGNYIISANIKNQASYKVEQILNVLPLSVNDILNISFEPNATIRADGLTTFKVISTLTNTPAKSVIITTSAGEIQDSETPNSKTLEVSQEGRAEANIQVGTEVKNYLITAKLPNSSTSLTKTIALERAYPDNMIIEPASTIIDPSGNAVSIDIYLKRERGKVSEGTSLNSIKAYQQPTAQENVSVGRFTGVSNTSDSNGKLTVQFAADSGNLIKDKPIIIEVSSRKDDGTLIVENVNLKIKE